MPERWCVTWNGQKFKGPYVRRSDAEKVAERWQGSSTTYGDRKRGGLLKHKDFGDHIEVRRDKEAERDLDERYDNMKRGNLQEITYER